MVEDVHLTDTAEMKRKKRKIALDAPRSLDVWAAQPVRPRSVMATGRPFCGD